MLIMINNNQDTMKNKPSRCLKVYQLLNTPCSPQQIDLNYHIDYLLLPNNRTRRLDFLTSLDSKLPNLFVSHIPETGAVQHKNTTAYYSHTAAYIHLMNTKQMWP